MIEDPSNFNDEKKPSFIQALGYDDFLDHQNPAHASLQVPVTYIHKWRHELGAVIMHSSGATGLPKPIYQAPSYFVLYAVCHRMPEQNEPFENNVSTLPIYHISFSMKYILFSVHSH